MYSCFWAVYKWHSGSTVFEVTFAKVPWIFMSSNCRWRRTRSRKWRMIKSGRAIISAQLDECICMCVCVWSKQEIAAERANIAYNAYIFASNRASYNWVATHFTIHTFFLLPVNWIFREPIERVQYISKREQIRITHTVCWLRKNSISCI